MAPPCTLRSGLVSQPCAGIVNVTLPGEAFSSVIPVELTGILQGIAGQAGRAFEDGRHPTNST